MCAQQLCSRLTSGVQCRGARLENLALCLALVLPAALPRSLLQAWTLTSPRDCSVLCPSMPVAHWLPVFRMVAGLDFDLALRLFMDAFRPPGEGQKIDRIMQVGGGEPAFSRWMHCLSELCQTGRVVRQAAASARHWRPAAHQPAPPFCSTVLPRRCLASATTRSCHPWA